MLSESPKEWVTEIAANVSLLHQTNSAVLIVRALSTARTPSLQKELMQVVAPHAQSLFAHRPACDILAGLLRYGTMRTCASVCEAVSAAPLFAPVLQSGAAAPAAASGGKKQKQQQATDAFAAAGASGAAEVFAHLAPFVEAAAFRVDIDERKLILAPLVAFLSSALATASAGAGFGQDLFRTFGSNALRCLYAVLAEKRAQQAEDDDGGRNKATSPSFGDQLVGAVFSNKQKGGWLSTVVRGCGHSEASAAAGGANGGSAKSFVKIVQRAVEAARESEVPGRAAAVSRAFLESARSDVCAADVSKIRVPFLTALLSRQRGGCPAMVEVARFVAARRPDIAASAFTAERSAQLVATLLNCLVPSASSTAPASSAPEVAAASDAARALAGAVIAAVTDWAALISASQVPQAILGLFLSIRQATQCFPELSARAPRDMAAVVDVATRQFLKQTLSAADVAQAAVQMRLAASNAAVSSASASAGVAASAASQPQQQQSKSKLLKVVDSSDDDADNGTAATTAAASGNQSRRRGRAGAEETTQPSPKNGAAKRK
jgi:hypothetical protein